MGGLGNQTPRPQQPHTAPHPPRDHANRNNHTLGPLLGCGRIQVGCGLGPRRVGVTVQHGDTFLFFFFFSSFVLCLRFFFTRFAIFYSVFEKPTIFENGRCENRVSKTEYFFKKNVKPTNKKPTIFSKKSLNRPNGTEYFLEKSQNRLKANRVFFEN